MHQVAETQKAQEIVLQAKERAKKMRRYCRGMSQLGCQGGLEGNERCAGACLSSRASLIEAVMVSLLPLD